MAIKIKRPTNKLDNRLTVFIIIIIVLMIFFIIYRNSQNSNNTSEVQNTQLFGSITGTVLELNNSKTLELGDKKINVPKNWEITTAYQNNDNSLIKCDTQNQTDCRIYVVNNGSSTLYISTPTFLIAPYAPEVKDVVKTITSNGQDIGAVYKALVLESRDENSDQSQPVTDKNIYYQVYGCFKQGFCINTSSLDSDLSKNQEQVKIFENFVKDIKIS